MTTHDESCEIQTANWPQFDNGQPYPCHCLARTHGRRKAEREIAAAARRFAKMERNAR